MLERDKSVDAFFWEECTNQVLHLRPCHTMKVNLWEADHALVSIRDVEKEVGACRRPLVFWHVDKPVRKGLLRSRVWHIDVPVSPGHAANQEASRALRQTRVQASSTTANVAGR